jgi:nucleoside-diphosphate-sugar epimerase
MAYLVTGGMGFIGSYVIRDLLKAGKEVVSLDVSGLTPLFRDVVGESNLDKVKIIQGDVSNTILVFETIQKHKINVIIHTAAIMTATSAISSESQPAYAIQVNCVGTNNLFEAARLFGLKKVVWTGTGQVFGQVGNYCKTAIGNDDAIYMPENMYTATKLLCEVMTRVYASRFGLDVVGLRIGLTLGIGKIHGKDNSFTQFIKNAATDVPTIMAAVDLDQPRAMGYIDNVSDLIVKVCETPATKTKNFNAVEYPVSCRQLVEAIKRVNPKASISLKDKVSSYEQTWPSTPEPRLDTTPIFQEIGWKPKYSLDEAIRQIFNYFRKEKKMPLL